MTTYTFYWNLRGRPNSATFSAADVFIAYMLFRRSHPAVRATRIEGRNS